MRPYLSIFRNGFLFALCLAFVISAPSRAIDSGFPDIWMNDPEGSRNEIGSTDSDQLLPLAANINVGSENIQHVVSRTPTFYWTYFDTSGSNQTMFELQVKVSTANDTDWTTGLMWSTGTTFSSDTSIVYAGAAFFPAPSHDVRIRVNNGSNWGDWLTLNFRLNDPPGTPIIISPIGQEPAPVNHVILEITPVSDRQQDPVTYGFEVYSDLGLSLQVASAEGVVEQFLRVRSIPIEGLQVGTEYWWRSRSADGFDVSDWSAASSFIPVAPSVVAVPTEFATIQDGINAAFSGDTVMVSPGIYTASIDYGDKIVYLVGAGSGQTILQPSDTFTPVVTIAGPGTNGSVFAGFTVRGGTRGETQATVVISITASSVTITDNVFLNNNEYCGGCYVINCLNASAQITRNLFYDNFVDACIAIGATDQGTLIINNTFDGNRFALRSESGGKVINNIITNSSSGGVISHHFETLEYNNVWNNIEDYSQGVPLNSISVDPEYMDRENHDYRLKPSSPCIDAGNPDTVYNDIDGSRNDMGAFPTGSLVCCINPGDANDDGSVNIADITFLITRIFAGGPASTCAGQADADGNGKVNIADATYLINRIFAGGLAPVCGTTSS